MLFDDDDDGPSAPGAAATCAPYPDRPLKALRDARALYRRLAQNLAEELRKLGKGLASWGEDDRLAKLVTLHNKTLGQLLEFEDRVEKRIAERVGRGRGDIDLAGARREILGKLARLGAALGAGGAGGGAEPERA